MRVAIATVGTTGDVAPFVALGVALSAAGHQVEAVAWDLHRPAFEGAGISFAATGPATDADQVAATARRAAAARSPLDQVIVLRDFHLRDGARHYAALREALDGRDLVVLHGIHSLAEAAARDVGARWVTAVFDPVLLPTGRRPPAGMPPLGPLNRAGWWLLDRLLAPAGRPLEDLLRAAGSPSAAAIRLFRARSPLLHLVAASPILAAEPDDLPPHVVHTGAWMRPGPAEPLPAEVERFLSAGEPPLAVTFGSMSAPDEGPFAAAVDRALDRVGRRAVVQRGGGGPVPSGADRLLVGRLDHRALFPRCVAVVHHGGAGTSHAAAAAGVPSVVVPHVGDQRFWAARLQALGVAPRPVSPTRLTADALADRIEAALAPAMPVAAAALAERLRAEDGVAEAVRRIDRLGSI